MPNNPPLERKVVFSLASLYVLRMLGLFMVLPVLAVLGVEYSGATPVLLGVALGIYGLTQAAFQIPLGALSDYVGRKPVIVFGLILFFIGSVVAAEATSIWQLITGRALQGAGAIAAAIMALLTDLTSENNRTKAMASLGISIGVAFAASLVIGPLIASTWGLSGIFWLSAILVIPGFWIILKVLPTPAKSVGAGQQKPIYQQIGSVFLHPQLLRLDVGVFVLHLLMTSLFVVMPGILFENLGIAVAQHWLIYLPVMVVSFIAMIPLVIIAEKHRKMKPVFLSAITFLLISTLLLSGFNDSLVVCVIMLFVFFLGFNLLEATLPSLMSKQASSDTKGSASGVYSTFQFMGAFVGGALGGYLSQHFGAQSVFYVGAALTGVWLLIAMTMSIPKALSSVIVETSQTQFFRVEPQLRGINGVYDVTFIEEESSAHLRVDEKEFEVSNIEALGLRATIR
ncbi:MFS transporter [Sessilibacter corallicola]|uniref:MFS transporter n=1 Tax=Sessilibacter corallicola TaxID=2904075 RepID=A0ABQ0ADR2_9GAMM|nr:MFS transporter [Sessilibacter corallicola]